MEFEGLAEAAIIGIPDDVLGEAVKAFVVARDSNCAGIEEASLRFCKAHLPPQHVPREIVVVQRLPKNSAGKVLKHKLKKL